MTERILKIPQFWLSLDACQKLYENFRKLETTEPIPPFETRYPQKLESILKSVSQTYAGNYLNATIADAAAAYFNQIIRGHPFQNGNKRMAVFFTHIFLLLNRVDTNLTFGEMFNLAVALAEAPEKYKLSADQTKELCKSILLESSIDRI